MGQCIYREFESKSLETRLRVEWDYGREPSQQAWLLVKGGITGALLDALEAYRGEIGLEISMNEIDTVARQIGTLKACIRKELRTLLQEESRRAWDAEDEHEDDGSNGHATH